MSNEELKMLAVAMDGFNALHFIHEHMRTQICQRCSQATSRRIIGLIDDDGFLKECCKPIRTASEAVIAARKLNVNMKKALDELTGF